MYWLAGLCLTLLALYSAGHALLNKRDPRAALGWITLCLAVPGLGPLLYWLAGRNRVRTRAQNWQETGIGLPLLSSRSCPWPQGASDAERPWQFDNYRAMLNLADAVTRRPLLPGNRLTPLFNGEQAFPEMLQAIESARESIFLSSYIFESNASGRSFVDRLSAAAERGLDVRVLIDALGERYSWPPIRRLFRKSAVKVQRFLPFSPFGKGVYFNLRNHRKLLVVDNRVGFTGGMNIGDRHLVVEANKPKRVQDLHSKIEGPVVSHLQESFLEDWGFATNEDIPPPPPPSMPSASGAFCRGISDGPNEDFEKLTWLIVGALNNAYTSVRIMTPYFIPDRSLVTAINAAALRGVRTDIILPERSNLPFVDWASRAYFWEFLERNVRIHLQPGPFAHTKYLLVDDFYALVGSANLDPRSLRLNFEFNLEVYDANFNATLAAHFEHTRRISQQLSKADVDARPLAEKLRDSFCKLFSPYL